MVGASQQTGGLWRLPPHAMGPAEVAFEPTIQRTGRFAHTFALLVKPVEAWKRNLLLNRALVGGGRAGGLVESVHTYLANYNYPFI